MIKLFNKYGYFKIAWDAEEIEKANRAGFIYTEAPQTVAQATVYAVGTIEKEGGKIGGHRNLFDEWSCRF